MNQFHTAESVTEGHPDKLCDLIADSVLDECLSHDALSRVACEVLATRGQIIVAGEITSLFEPQIPAIAHSVLQKVGYDPARYPSHAVREDIRRLDKRIEQAEFIFKNHIEDRGQLAAIRQKAEDEIAVLIKQRQKLYRYEPGSPQIGVLTEQLQKLRHTAKLPLPEKPPAMWAKTSCVPMPECVWKEPSLRWPALSFLSWRLLRLQ